ncbi:type IV pilus assembly protein PilM [Clostridium sp. 'White wine YQ']|uniref:type IV pilus assembly protein PilM n=1 Tax=Clostridium sp. 'White wine YQ' TaxID=3027474 RepID=UPI00236699D4|nr:type IV pilus assembly protein PilM [Clostridium sp. 'White wine YQ']MDD7795766.1 type IV pilus assembly protein PilM [Clostridium sp. 'White wine YQ']
MAANKLKSINLDTIKKLMNTDLSSLRNKINQQSNKKSQKKRREVNKTFLSFDLGSEKIKIAVGKFYKGKFTIEKLITADTPEDSIQDGNIMNLPALEYFIMQKLSNENIKIKDAICTNNSTSIINREIVIPEVQEDEIDTVVKYEIQQYLPLNMNDYIIQSKVIEKAEIEGKKGLRTLVITYPDRMASTYYKTLTNVGLKPVALDISYNSLNKLLNNSRKINDSEYNSKDTLAFIDLGANSLGVNIYRDGNLDFSRIIKSGGSNIDVAISKTLELPISEAEKIKVTSGSLSNIEENEVNSIIKDVVDEWISELQRIIQFYRNRKMGNTIDKIFIYGGSSSIKGIEEYITDKIGISTEKVQSIDSINYGESIEKYLNAIGALIRI